MFITACQRIAKSCRQSLHLPEDVFIEARGEGVGQLVTEEAEVVEVEGGPYLGPHIPQHPTEHRHKLTLIPHLQQQCCWLPGSAMLSSKKAYSKASTGSHTHFDPAPAATMLLATWVRGALSLAILRSFHR